jgi:tRNA threonylcarbamoyladenosine biosynthesis protein TsaE
VISVVSRDESCTARVAAAVAAVVRPRDLIVLAGPMGAGKTAFTRGFAAALGVSRDEDVTSPTFTLVHEYRTGRVPLHHADLYRLRTLGEVADLGLRERADLGAVVIVEWGDVAAGVLGDHLRIDIEPDEDDDDTRHLTVSVEGHSWDARWERLRTAVTGAAS